MEDYNEKMAKFKSMPQSQRDTTPIPRKPTHKRYIVQDCTIEALIPILKDNPRGVLVARDELSGWLRGFNQYKGGRGSDEPIWLEIHNAGPIMSDRKTGDNKNINVPEAVASITGTIQPGVLESLMTPERVESGMAARILMVNPPRHQKRWNKKLSSEATDLAYSQLIRTLSSIPLPRSNDVSDSRALPLTEEAEHVWADWYNIHATRQHNTVEDNKTAIYAKLEGYTARFALVLTLANNPHATKITYDSMRAAIRLTEWFIQETDRVTDLSTDSIKQQEKLKLIDTILCSGGVTTRRDLMRIKGSTYKTASEAQRDLDALANDGLLIKENDESNNGSKGGRPRNPKYRLANTTTALNPPTLSADSVSSTMNNIGAAA